MAYDLKSESEVKEYLHNLGIEYRFGCYSEKNPEVCHLLGDFLEAVKKDFKKASNVYKTNCDEHNYGKSCLKYGTYALLGKAMEKPDYKQAFDYFEKGCKKDDPQACFNQGVLLVSNNEITGIKEDHKKGVELIEKACLAKNASACYFLSGMFISGVKKKKSTQEKKDDNKEEPEYIMPKDMNKAFKYTQEGCHLGNIYCCANLSQMYRKGDGVKQNQELADQYKKVALEMQNEMTGNQTLTFQEGLKS